MCVCARRARENVTGNPDFDSLTLTGITERERERVCVCVYASHVRVRHMYASHIIIRHVCAHARICVRRV